MDEVGSRVKRERTMRGWSQRDLAKRAKVTAETISTVETGQHDPRPSTLRKLADALGVEGRELFEEPALPKAEAPREAGQPDKETQIFDMVYDAFLQQSVEDAKTTNRADASGSMQVSHVRHENEALHRLLEHPQGDIASAYVDLMRRFVRLEQKLARGNEESTILRDQLQEREQAHS